MSWSRYGGLLTLFAAFGLVACGGGTTSSSETGGSGGNGGDAAPSEGGSRSQVGGSTSAGGGAGDYSSGGETSTGGSGPPGTGGTGVINCDNVGCGPPPMCSTGCQDPCGCCPCSEDEGMAVEGVRYVCTGGCWAPAEDGCDYLGTTHPVGSTFSAGDGCNTCTCQAGGIAACTQMACACDPAAEVRQREYVAESPAACAVIDYVCPANTTYFDNACGCGCEQDPSCPEWFNCMPSPDAPPCDEAQIHADCPYSGIAY